MWRVLILSSLLLAAQGACGGAPRPAAAPASSDQVQRISELHAELRMLEQDRPDDGDDLYAEMVCGIRDETCDLAGELGDNAWADEKCVRACRACRAARAPCAQATARPPTF